MKFRIPIGKHRARPFRFAIWHDKKVIRHKVLFHQDCKYWINGPDQQDVNKLFGIGYFPSHLHHSARFGWRYDRETGRMEILAFTHVKGVQSFTAICQIRFGLWYRFELISVDGWYGFSVYDDNVGYEVGSVIVPKPHRRKWSYRLGTYFGGNRVAPQNMTIEIK